MDHDARLETLTIEELEELLHSLSRDIDVCNNLLAKKRIRELEIDAAIRDLQAESTVIKSEKQLLWAEVRTKSEKMLQPKIILNEEKLVHEVLMDNTPPCVPVPVPSPHRGVYAVHRFVPVQEIFSSVISEPITFQDIITVTAAVHRVHMHIRENKADILQKIRTFSDYSPAEIVGRPHGDDSPPMLERRWMQFLGIAKFALLAEPILNPSEGYPLAKFVKNTLVYLVQESHSIFSFRGPPESMFLASLHHVIKTRGSYDRDHGSVGGRRAVELLASLLVSRFRQKEEKLPWEDEESEPRAEHLTHTMRGAFLSAVGRAATGSKYGKVRALHSPKSMKPHWTVTEPPSPPPFFALDLN